MAYEKNTWRARNVQYPNRFTKQNETATSVTLIENPGTITDTGTPFSVEWMNHLEQGVAEAHQIVDANFRTLNSHADAVDGAGRNLLSVLGVSTISQAMAALRTLCNGTGTPNFSGLMIGDYIDGLDLSGVEAAPGGTAPQAWNGFYRNNRIVLSGFNTYKGTGAFENAKNHILFTFRNCIALGAMNPEGGNGGGYSATAARAWLEGADGDGSGPLATRLKAAIGGDYLYTISSRWNDSPDPYYIPLTLWIPSEIEVFGRMGHGAGGASSLNTHFPIYQHSGEYLVKRFNGVRKSWFEGSPMSTTYFCCVGMYGNMGGLSASNTEAGISPVFCVC